MYNSSEIADRIKACADEKHLTLKHVLSDANLGANLMANMKTSMPKADSLGKIADVLGCSVDYLLGRTEDASPPNYPVDAQPTSVPLSLSLSEWSKAVKKAMVDHNDMTVTELAKKTGYSRTHVSQVVNGMLMPSNTLKGAIEKILDIAPTPAQVEAQEQLLAMARDLTDSEIEEVLRYIRFLKYSEREQFPQ